MKTWVVPVAVTLAYCNAAHCPGGACETPRTSLLQLKSLSQKTESLAMGAGSSTSAALAGFQKFTDEMIAKYGRSGPSAGSRQANGSELQAVNIILGFLDDMYSTFDTSHMDAKQKGDECYGFAYHTHCPFDWGTYDEFHKQWREAQEDHYHCRRDAQIGCKGTPPHCDHYDQFRMNEPKAKMPACIRQGMFNDDHFSATSNALKADHSSCTGSKSGWTHGNPFSLCDSDISNPPQAVSTDLALTTEKVFGGVTKTWTAATFDESKAYCRARGFSTESGNYYGGCSDATTMKNNKWAAWGCGPTATQPRELTTCSCVKVNQFVTTCTADSGSALCTSTTNFVLDTTWQNPGDLSAIGNAHVWSRASIDNRTSAHVYDAQSWYAMTNSYASNIPSQFNDRAEAESVAYSTMGCSVPSQSNPYPDCFLPDASTRCTPSTPTCNVTWNDFDTYRNGITMADLSTWIGSSSEFLTIDEDTPFIYTFGGDGEFVFENVDTCRTNVVGKLILAGRTDLIPTETEWKTLRTADRSTEETKIDEILTAAGELTCGTNEVQPPADGLCLDTAGSEMECSDCACGTSQAFQPYKLFCPNDAKYSASNATCISSDCSACLYNDATDLLDVPYSYMDTSSTCSDGSPTEHFTYMYINPNSGYHALLKFEECLDLTFDWLYGEKKVTSTEQQNYIGATSTTVTPGGPGRALLYGLYAEKRDGDTTNYWDKLNGEWTHNSNPGNSAGVYTARTGAFSASDTVTTTAAIGGHTSTECTSPGGGTMRWTRKPGWDSKDVQYVAWMEPDGDRTEWGLWQHYVKCELAENHRAATLYGGSSDSQTTGYWEVDNKTSSGGTKNYWSTGMNAIKSASAGTTWANAGNSSYYSHESEWEANGTITEKTHCAYVDGVCIDQWHIRCFDYYFMCSALQRRAEAAYLEWRTYRESECSSQERCLTGGPDKSTYTATELNQKKDSQLFKCSETCAIEHENAKAREADNETAERLRCMLAALFGQPNMVSIGGVEVPPNATETAQAGTAGASDTCVVGSTTASERCPQFESCYKGEGCRAASDADIWTSAGTADDRSTKLAACNREIYVTSYWELKQEECPSWNTVDRPFRSYWGTKDQGQWATWTAASNAADTKFTGSWSSSTLKTRKNCGTKTEGGVAATNLCKDQCTAKRASYNSANKNGSFWDSWSTIYQTCATENFLTTDWWNTHDVCHLTVFDHDGTKDQIIDPRRRTSNTPESTYVAAAATTATDDENPLVAEDWGKWAFDFCDSGSLDTSKTGDSTSAIYKGRKYLHSIGWDNQAEASTTASDIFPYARKNGAIEFLTTWTEWRAVSSSITALCSVDATDASITPASVTHDDQLDQIGKVHCWKQRAESLIVDDEFGPTSCK